MAAVPGRKRVRGSVAAEDVSLDMLHPLPAPEAAYSMVLAFERAVASADLTTLNTKQITQWLQAMPSWIRWLLDCSEISRDAVANASSSQPATPAGSTVSASTGAFPSAPLTSSRLQRIHVADASTALLHLADALGTMPWDRLTPSHGPPTTGGGGGQTTLPAKMVALTAAFEDACVALLSVSTLPALIVPVIDAALKPLRPSAESTMELLTSALGMQGSDPLVPHRAPSGGGGEKRRLAPNGLVARVIAVADDRGVGPAVDVAQIARIVNAAALAHPAKAVDLLQRTVPSHFPPARWPVASTGRNYMTLFLLLAGLPAPPRGYDVGSSVGRSLTNPLSPGQSPALPSSQHKATKTITDEGDEDGADQRHAVVAGGGEGGNRGAGMTPFLVADHRGLLVEGALSQLLATDTALTADSTDSCALANHRRLVGHVAELFQRSLRRHMEADDEVGLQSWLPALTTFHQQRVMPVSDTKAVHMLVPMVIAACQPHHVASFLHGCISAVKNNSAVEVRTKICATSHLGPLLVLLGGAFALSSSSARGGSVPADAELGGLIRRMAKLCAKAAEQKSTAGMLMFAESLFVQLTTVSKAFGCPVQGKDLSAETVAAFSQRNPPGTPAATVRPRARLRETATAVVELYTCGKVPLEAYGDRPSGALRRLRDTHVSVSFE